jgi:hypothetical protein
MRLTHCSAMEPECEDLCSPQMNVSSARPLCIVWKKRSYLDGR